MSYQGEGSTDRYIYHLLYLQWNYIGEGGLWCVHHWFVSLVLNSNMCYLTLKASYWFILIIYLINRNLQNKEKDQAKGFMNVPWLCLQFGDFLLDLFNLYLQMTSPCWFEGCYHNVIQEHSAIFRQKGFFPNLLRCIEICWTHAFPNQNEQ